MNDDITILWSRSYEKQLVYVHVYNQSGIANPFMRPSEIKRSGDSHQINVYKWNVINNQFPVTSAFYFQEGA